MNSLPATIGVWHVGGIARLEGGSEAEIQVTADSIVDRDLLVNLSARREQETRQIVTTLEKNLRTVSAVFPPDVLTVGGWLVTASAPGINVSRARTVVRVGLPPLIDFVADSPVAAGQDARVTVQFGGSPSREMEVMVTATQGGKTVEREVRPASDADSAIHIVFPTDVNNSSDMLGRGLWDLRMVANELGQVIEATTILQVDNIAVNLVAAQQGDAVRIQMQLSDALNVPVRMQVLAEQAGATSVTQAVTISPGDQSGLAVFEMLGMGTWRFTASAPEQTELINPVSIEFTLRQQVLLEVEQDSLQAGSTVSVTVRLVGPPVEQSLLVTVTARQGDNTETISVRLQGGERSGAAHFVPGMLGPGEWVFTASVPEVRRIDTDASLAQVAVRIVNLPIELTAFQLGTTAVIWVSLRNPQSFAVLVTVTAVRADGMNRVRRLDLLPGSRFGQVSFGDLGVGAWTFTADTLGGVEDPEIAIADLRLVPQLALAVEQGAPPASEGGFLVQNSLYRNGQAGVNGLIRSGEGIAAHPFGGLLFVNGGLTEGGGSLSVWRMDETAVLTGQLSRQTGDQAVGGRGLAVSPDGHLVFSAGLVEGRGALSVWRVNAVTGDLNRTALYIDDREYVQGLLNPDTGRRAAVGLGGISRIAVSPDGRLLFVTAREDDALSVWRVDSARGMLTQSDAHCKNVFNCPGGTGSVGRGLDGASAVVASPDGNLLFVTAFDRENALSVWRVNAAAGTVVHGRRYTDSTNLPRPRSMTISPDGRLLFVASQTSSGNPLSVWRVDTAGASLSLVRGYRDGGGISGLRNPVGLAVTNDLLFVAGHNSNALSVWRVDAEGDEPLAHIATYANGQNRQEGLGDRVQGLAGLLGAAASPGGGHVFVTSFRDNALSSWRVEGLPEWPAERAVPVMVSASEALQMPTTVTVLARQGGRMRTMSAVLGTLESSVQVEFPAAMLGPGEWVFTASVSEDRRGDVGTLGARGALRIASPLALPIEELTAFQLGTAAVVWISLREPLADAVRITVMAVHTEGSSRSESISMPRGADFGYVRFAGLDFGTWTFSADAPEGVEDPAAASATLRLVPQLRLQVEQGAPPASEGGFLVQNSLYRNGQAGVNGLIRPGEGIAAHPFGGLLFVNGGLTEGGGSLSVWRMDETAVLTRQLSQQTGDQAVGGRGLAVSPDGHLVFSAGLVEGRGALSVWRVNAVTGDLNRTALYIDDREYVQGLLNPDTGRRAAVGLGGISRIAVSPDGRLLFVTAREDDALSVWRVDSARGMLTQSDAHCKNVFNCPGGTGSVGQGLDGAAAVVASPDGNLLFVTAFDRENALSVWRVNAAAGTVVHGRRYTDSTNLPRPRSMTISPDGRLLFVASQTSSGNPLSVWRVDTAGASLSLVRGYRDGGGISGLRNPVGLAVTDDLLFVAGFASNALSVWRVDAEGDEPLAHIATYANGQNRQEGLGGRVQGLTGLLGAAASPGGGHVFVTSFLDNALSSWRAEGLPEWPAERAVPVMVSVREALQMPTTVTVLARQGERMQMMSAVLGTLESSVQVEFPAAMLGRGEWVFTASVSEDRRGDVGTLGARGTLRIASLPVLPVELTVFQLGTTAVVWVSLRELQSFAVSVTVTVTRADGMNRVRRLDLLPGTDFASVTFGNLEPGAWTFMANTPDGFIDPDAARAELVLLPLLSLEVEQEAVLEEQFRLVQLDMFTPAIGNFVPGESIAVGRPGGLVITSGRREGLYGRGNLGVFYADSLTGALVKVGTCGNPGGCEGVSSAMALSPEERYLFTAGLGQPYIVPYKPVQRAGASLVFAVLPDGRLGARIHRIQEILIQANTVSGIKGLGVSARHALAVSPDGRLVFITASSGAFRDTLSVWRANDNGSLVMRELHCHSSNCPNGIGGGGRALKDAVSVAVSPAGRLLFIAAGGGSEPRLGVWRVYPDTESIVHGHTYTDAVNLAAPRFITVSPDGRLLFVGGGGTNPLSVWRVNAADASLSFVQGYRNNAAEGITGLNRPIGMAATRDGLLFVTGFSDDALSVWRMDTESSSTPLVYIDTYTHRESRGTGIDGRIQGLDGAIGAGVSAAGGNLFVIAQTARALSTWRIEGVSRQPVSSTVRVQVRVSTGLAEQTTVRVTAAQRGREETVSVLLGEREQYAEAEFSAGVLGPGEWTLRAFVPAEREDEVDASAARASVRINPSLQAQVTINVFQAGSSKMGVQIAATGMLFYARVGITAELPGVTSRSSSVELSYSSLSGQLSFENLEPGIWTVKASLLEGREDEVDLSAASATVYIAPPVPSAELVAFRKDDVAVVWVNVHELQSTTVQVTVTATQSGSGDRRVRRVDLSPGASFSQLNFSGLSFGTWTFSADESGAAEDFTIGPAELRWGHRLGLKVEREAVHERQVYLIQRSLHSDDETSINGLRNPEEGIAVSPSGRLVFVSGGFAGGGSLSVWRGNNSVAGLTTQTSRYTGEQGVGGRGLAASPDGRWVFSAGRNGGRDILSVWRLNESTDSLSRTALYFDDEERQEGLLDPETGRRIIMGLGAASRMVVSPDSRLLFVTASGDNALSVWRIDSESGTLEQRDVHCANVTNCPGGTGGTGRGLDGASAVAVSPDGNLLFVTAFDRENALSVWRVNAAAGTVAHGRRYTDSTNLPRPRSMTISPDGRLLFVASQTRSGNPLSVWRVDAASITLSLVQGYRDNTAEDITGLARPIGMAATADGLLFVAGLESNALSVWRVDAESGNPLIHIDTYADEEIRVEGIDGTIQGLDGAIGIAISPSGSQVFITGHRSNSLTAWRVYGTPQLSAGSTVTVVVQARDSLSEPTTVTVTARQGTLARMLTRQLAASSSTVAVEFPAGLLSPGEWIFTASASTNSEYVDISAARAAAWIDVPAPAAELFVSRLTSGTVAVELAVSDPLLRIVPVTITAEQGMTSLTRSVNLHLRRQAGTALFENLANGTWRFTASEPGQRVNTQSAYAEIYLGPQPVLHLAVEQGIVPVGPLRLLQVGLHADGQAGIDGLAGPEEGLAVNPNGGLVFVSSQEDKSLSTWRTDSVSGNLEQVAVYKNGENRVEGLNGHVDGLGGHSVAISPDNRLVFATGVSGTTGTLSVWRVNADAGTLTQTALYKNGELRPEWSGGTAEEQTVRGLGGIRRVAISPDGKLLFAAAGGSGADNALSVWRVNKRMGVLEQSNVHCHSIVCPGGIGGWERGLNGISAVAVSPDSNLLFVTSFGIENALSVWAVNADAGRVAYVRMYTDGINLRRPRHVTVSPDGRLLFVTSRTGEGQPLSVWRVNAASAALRFVRGYSNNDADEAVSGLNSPVGVAVAADGLLFVAGSMSDALSVWRIDAASDTPLALIDTYVNGMRREEGLNGNIQGLAGATGVAISPGGSQVFVAGQRDNALSVWQVTQIPRQPAGRTISVMVSADDLLEPVEVTVIAKQGVLERRATATLTVSGAAALADFPAGVLDPGEWVFTALVPEDRADDVDVSVAKAVVRIDPPLPLPIDLSAVRRASGVAVRISLRELQDTAVKVTVTAEQRGSASRSQQLDLEPGEHFGQVFFADLASGAWTFTANTPFGVKDPAAARRELVIVPSLSLTVEQGVATDGPVHLLQADLHTDGRAGIDGLAGPEEGLAVSPDGVLVFVSSNEDKSLSVWRLDSFSGDLERVALYKNGENRMEGLKGRVDGLGGAGIAVSPDGRLVFATGVSGTTDALSVWRVNAVAGTLTQTALYKDEELRPEWPGDTAEEQTVRRLGGIRRIAVSPDGNLLFVAADRALSVWRVDKTAGALVQGDVHCGTVFCPGGAGAVPSLMGALGIAVSPNDNLLFVTVSGTANALSVWGVDTAFGGIIRIAAYERVLGPRLDNGLSNPQDVVLHPNGKLLAVLSNTDPADSTAAPLGLWLININGNETSLAWSQSYRNDSGAGISGLNTPAGAAFTFDGLLFVTGRSEDSLSIWQQRAGSIDGSFQLVDIYRDGVSRREGLDGIVDGLDQAVGVAVSPAGGQVFVTGARDNALSAWRVEGIARLSADSTVRVTISVNSTLRETVAVTVMARQGELERITTAILTVSGEPVSADFPAGVLTPGEWLLAASVPGDRMGEVDISAAKASVRIAGLTTVLNVPGMVAAGQPVRIQVQATGALASTVTVRVTAERLSAPPGISTGAVQVAEGLLPSGLEDPSAELAFGGGQLGSGLWRMTAKTVPAGLLAFAAESTEVRVALPRLRLQPEASPVPAQNEVVIQVIVEPAPEAAVRVEVAGDAARRCGTGDPHGDGQPSSGPQSRCGQQRERCLKAGFPVLRPAPGISARGLLRRGLCRCRRRLPRWR